MGTRIKLAVFCDLQGALDEAISGVYLSGLGADGTSEYDIVDVSVTPDDDPGPRFYCFRCAVVYLMDLHRGEHK